MTRQWISTIHTWQTNDMGGDGTDATDVNANEEIRDRFEMLTDHPHDGSAGEGSAALAPQTVLLTDKSDEAAPAAGKTVVWTGSGRLKQRTNGGSVEIIQEAHASHTSATT